MSRLIIVEDEFVVAADLKLQLQTMGYQIIGLVPSGEQALELARKAPPDLVLMDIKLKGGKDGLETARCMRDELDVPVIFLTAFAEGSLLERAKLTEPFGFLVKPFSNKELKATIEMAVYKAQKEREIKESEFRYRTLAESSPSTVEVVQNGKYVYINKAGAQMFGFPNPGEIIGVSMLDLVAPEYRYKAAERLSETAMGRNNPPAEFEMIRRDGTRILIESVSASTQFQNQPATLIIGHDITNRIRAETVLAETQKDLTIAQEKLRELYHTLQKAREEERRKVAREVHDDLGQDLTALQLEIALLKGNPVQDATLLAEKLGSMKQLVDSALMTVHRVSTELRPSVLDALGLAPAVEWLVEDFRKRTQIDCRIRIEPEEIQSGDEIATDLFRVLQEALANVARHSQASCVQVSLLHRWNSIELTVTDNGLGISDIQANCISSFGLQGIRERVLGLGGVVNIQGIPGEGTSINIIIPKEAGLE